MSSLKTSICSGWEYENGFFIPFFLTKMLSLFTYKICIFFQLLTSLIDFLPSKVYLPFCHFSSRICFLFVMMNLLRRVFSSHSYSYDQWIKTLYSTKKCRYSYHFPELYKVVPEPLKYVKCAIEILDRSAFSSPCQIISCLEGQYSKKTNASGVL